MPAKSAQRSAKANANSKTALPRCDSFLVRFMARLLIQHHRVKVSGVGSPRTSAAGAGRTDVDGTDRARTPGVSGSRLQKEIRESDHLFGSISVSAPGGGIADRDSDDAAAITDSGRFILSPRQRGLVGILVRTFRQRGEYRGAPVTGHSAKCRTSRDGRRCGIRIRIAAVHDHATQRAIPVSLAQVNKPVLRRWIRIREAG